MKLIEAKYTFNEYLCQCLFARLIDNVLAIRLVENAVWMYVDRIHKKEILKHSYERSKFKIESIGSNKAR